MYSNKMQPDEMSYHRMSDEEINVCDVNSGEEEDEMMREGGPDVGTYRHPAEVYMVNDDDAIYDDVDDQLQYGYVDDVQYANQPLDTEGYIDAHYINTEHGYMGKDLNDIYQITQSPQNVELRSTADRLAKLPEMRHLPPLRRIQRKGAGREVPKFRKILDPKASGLNALLVANGLYPSTEGELKPKIHKETTIPTEDFLKLPRLANGQPILCDQTSLSKMYRHRPNSSFPDPKNIDGQPMMTPLPDRFFQKRCTITAEQAGFNSECLPCRHCNCVFKQKSLLNTHEKKHMEQTRGPIMSARSGLICPMDQCYVRCDCIATVIQHMKLAHSINDIRFERIIFKNMTEFKLWRSELERLTMSKFSRTSGKQNIYSKSTYYQCHHSGNMKSRVDPNEKQRKRETKKLGKTCTAFFHVRENDDGTILLRGCTQHSGHGRDVRALPVTDDIKMEIAQLLIDGMDENEIVEKMQQESDKTNRRFYLQNYEVRNVYNKIEKFKEEYKRKINAGEAPLDLAEAVSSRHDRPMFPSVGSRAKLSCSRFPVIEQYEMEYEYEQEPASTASYEEVVEDDGLFHVPKGPDEEFVERQKTEEKDHKRRKLDDDNDKDYEEEEGPSDRQEVVQSRYATRYGGKKHVI